MRKSQKLWDLSYRMLCCTLTSTKKSTSIPIGIESPVNLIFDRLTTPAARRHLYNEKLKYNFLVTDNHRKYATIPSRNKRNQYKPKTAKNLPLKNNEITAKTVRLVYPDGDKDTTVMTLDEARREAEARGLDLVMASANANPPVARIASWEKIIYSMRQKEKAAERAARENKRLAIPKEIRLGSNIAVHDLKVKVAAAKKILEEKHVLKVSVIFKRRKEADEAKSVLMQLVESLEGIGKVKDPQQFVKPQVNRWIIQFEPITHPN